VFCDVAEVRLKLDYQQFKTFLGPIFKGQACIIFGLLHLEDGTDMMSLIGSSNQLPNCHATLQKR